MSIKQTNITDILDIMVDEFSVGIIAALDKNSNTAKVNGVVMLLTNGKNEKFTHTMSVACAEALIGAIADVLNRREELVDEVAIPAKAFKHDTVVCQCPACVNERAIKEKGIN